MNRRTFLRGLTFGVVATPLAAAAQQPSTFELVVNVRAAKALELTIPPSLPLRADHVIQ